MDDVVKAAVFVVVFFGLLAFFLASRLRVRLLALLVLSFCLLYYLFRLRVL